MITKRMLLKAALSMTLGMSLATVLPAQAAQPEQGKEYKTLRQPQPTDTGKKIEVIEFFAYYCPHCYALEPILADWVKKQGDRIVYKRYHVMNPGIESQFKLFNALESLGKVDEYQTKVFEAFHQQRNRLVTDEQVAEFVSKTKLDKATFFSAYNSFTVKMKLNRVQRVMADYEIESWPTIIVDGRLMTSPSMAVEGKGRVTEQQQNEALLPVLDWLVAKAQKEKSAK